MTLKLLFTDTLPRTVNELIWVVPVTLKDLLELFNITLPVITTSFNVVTFLTSKLLCITTLLQNVDVPPTVNVFLTVEFANTFILLLIVKLLYIFIDPYTLTVLENDVIPFKVIGPFVITVPLTVKLLQSVVFPSTVRSDCILAGPIELILDETKSLTVTDANCTF